MEELGTSLPCLSLWLPCCSQGASPRGAGEGLAALQVSLTCR